MVMIKKLLREGLELNSFINEWSDFIMDLSDYNIDDMPSLYKEGLVSLNRKIKNNSFIFRGMAVNNEWLNHIKKINQVKIGRFWSFNKSISNSFTLSSDVYDTEYSSFKGLNKMLVIAKTPINLSVIDINATIAHELVSSEDELRLHKNKQLDVISIFINGERIDITNKIFIS